MLLVLTAMDLISALNYQLLIKNDDGEVDQTICLTQAVIMQFFEVSNSKTRARGCGPDLGVGRTYSQ